MPLRLSASALKNLVAGRGLAVNPPPGRAGRRGPGVKAHAADTLVFQLKIERLPPAEREYRFHPTRRYRFDIAWPDRKLALEIEGVVYPDKRDDDRTVLRGRHVTPKGFRDDCIKYGEAFALGWTVLRVLPEQILDGSALRWLTARLR